MSNSTDNIINNINSMLMSVKHPTFPIRGLKVLWMTDNGHNLNCILCDKKNYYVYYDGCWHALIKKDVRINPEYAIRIANIFWKASLISSRGFDIYTKSLEKDINDEKMNCRLARLKIEAEELGFSITKKS